MNILALSTGEAGQKLTIYEPLIFLVALLVVLGIMMAKTKMPALVLIPYLLGIFTLPAYNHNKTVTAIEVFPVNHPEWFSVGTIIVALLGGIYILAKVK